MNWLEPLLARFATTAVPLAPLSAVSWHELIPSIRTGDILLYGTLPTRTWSGASSAERGKLVVAASLARLCSLLPCAAYASLACAGANANSGGGDEEEGVADQLAVIPFDIGEWSDAALLVCVGSPAKPSVFVSVGGSFRLVPVEQHMAAVGARVGGLRHLLIRDELELNEPAARLFSQRRAHLVDRMFEFQKSLVRRGPPFQPLVSLLADLLNRRPVPENLASVVPAPENSAAVSEAEQLALLHASVSYTTLQTLYAAQVLRLSPRAIDAAQLLQEANNSLLSTQLAADYQFGPERLISFQ